MTMEVPIRAPGGGEVVPERPPLAYPAAARALTACVAETVGPPRYRETVVGIAPPAPEVEVVGVAPHPGWVWQPGYWNWQGDRHVWVNGAWVEPSSRLRTSTEEAEAVIRQA